MEKKKLPRGKKGKKKITSYGRFLDLRLLSCSSLSVHKSRLEPAMRGRWKHAAETHESVMPPEKTTSREFTWNISRCLASPHESFFAWVSLSPSLSFPECVDPAYGNPGRVLHLRRHGLTGIKGRATRITSFFHRSSSIISFAHRRISRVAKKPVVYANTDTKTLVYC